MLTERFSNSAEYDLMDVNIEHLISALVETDHCLVYTQTFEEDGTYIIAPPILKDQPDKIRRILMQAFQVNEVDESPWVVGEGEDGEEEEEVDIGMHPIEFYIYEVWAQKHKKSVFYWIYSVKYSMEDGGVERWCDEQANRA